MNGKTDGGGGTTQWRSARLPERTLIALYNMGRVLKLNPGENLIPGYEKDAGVFFVMRGLLRIYGEYEGHFAEKTLFDNFDWFAPRVIDADSPLRYRIAAEEPSQVLALPEKTLATLDPPLLVYILRRVNESHVQRMRRIEREIAHADRVNHFLSTYIVETRNRRCLGYESSEVILPLLRNLPRLPAYSTRLIQLLEHDNTPQREVTRLVKEDPSLVSELLKTVNSPYYGFQKKISDVNYAVLYLGFNQIYQLLLSSGLRKIMPDTEEFQELHQHSVVISHLAHDICQFHDRQKASILGTLALLHDVGKSVILLLRKQNPKWAFFIDMLDSARTGALLLKEWGIPPMIHESIDTQVLAEVIPPLLMPTSHRESVAVLHAAHVACEMIQGHSDVLEHPFIEDIREMLQLPGESFKDFVDGHLLREMSGKLHTLPRHVRDLITRSSRDA
jgi:HD-like signal output (HDOD) protein